MATETPLAPEMAKKHKKQKKNKGNTDNNTKKRKREQEEQEVAPDSQPTERPSKKHKKDKDEHESAQKPKLHESDLLQSHPPFVQQTVSFYLPLSPCAYDFPLEGLCAEHISPLLLTYYPPLKGVLLSYANPRMSEHPSEGAQVESSNEARTVLSRSIDEYAVAYVWLTAEFITFRPRRGTYLEGYVSLQNESILGLVCYNYFNAVIERDKLPKDWRWEGDEDSSGKLKKKSKRNPTEGGGFFVDGDGRKVEGRLIFQVEDFEATAGSDTGSGTVSILGTMISEVDNT